MPQGNGMGPPGGGQGSGTGQGRGGQGARGQKGQGGAGRAGRGPGGMCVCPSCNEKTSHTQGQPCQAQNCPKCGTKMVREF